MTGDTQGALVGLAAFAAMAWLNRRPNNWWEDRPRDDRPSYRQTPTQVTIVRPNQGRELERWDDQ